MPPENLSGPRRRDGILDGADPCGSGASVVNHYRILGKLGAGGMGVVYKAADTLLDRTVALKFLPPRIENDPQARAHFLREARAASAIDHPNIGAIHAIEETPDGIAFLVMPYYAGETLARRIERGPLPRAQALGIAHQVADGLAEAHAREIVHRDIKPSNVILTEQGVAKIVDFGLARAVQSADSTASAHVAGTVWYMSPEQAMGRPLDARTDLWSLGVMLLEMLTGRRPFEGESAPSVLYAVVHEPPSNADRLADDLRPVVLKSLGKNPAERYQTAREMADDLARLEPAGASASAPTLTTGAAERLAWKQPRTWIPARWRRTARILTVALATAAALFFVPSIRQRLTGALLAPADKHIAVLPFTTAGAGADPLADGLMDTLTSRLSNLEAGSRSLWVVPASEVRKSKVSDAAAARKQFGATLVVNGTIERSGPAVRLIVNLIDTRRMAQLGSEELVDRTGDFSSLEEAAVQRLAWLMDASVPVGAPASAAAGAPPAAYELYLEALGLMARFDRPGNLDQAIARLEKAVNADARFALAYASLAEAYLLKYKTDRNAAWLGHAGAACQRAAQTGDQLAPIYVTLGRVHHETGKDDLALQEFQRALQLDRRSADALFGLASVYEAESRFQEAEQTLIRATALRPDYWDAFTRLGNFYLRQRRFADAIPPLRKVVDLTPDNAIGWSNLGAALRRAGKVEEAVSALNRSIRIGPSYAAYANLGTIYYQQRRFADAARRYERALALNDKDYIPWTNLAYAYLWLNRQADAISLYRRALPLVEERAKLRPNDPGVQRDLGLVYIYLRDRTNGFSHLNAAVALAPADGRTLRAVAEAYEFLGERRQAITWLRKALAAGQTPDSIVNDPVLHRTLDDPAFAAPVKGAK